MENPCTMLLLLYLLLYSLIIGNVSGAIGAETQINRGQNVSTDLDAKEPQTHDDIAMNIIEQTATNANDNTTANDNQTDEIDDQTDENDEQTVDTNESHDQCAAVRTRAMIAKEGKPPKPLHVKSNPGLDVSPDELLAAQKN